MTFFHYSGGLFSATAGPLLPSNIAFKPFNKMWRSPSQDNGDDGDDENMVEKRSQTVFCNNLKQSVKKSFNNPLGGGSGSASAQRRKRLRGAIHQFLIIILY
jgi:hypothetical protein